MTFRVGTRGSDLALWQTRVVARLLHQRHGIEVEEVIIRTHAEKRPEQSLSAGTWPAGGFVREIEEALLAGEVDFAIHSCKDLPRESPAGLVIAALLERGPMHDRLIARDAATAEMIRSLLAGSASASAPLRIGTSSPRRAAQLQRAFRAAVEIAPLRGNVPTRLRKLRDERLDAVMLAAAGLDRLALAPEHAIDLPLDRFPTAPAQGAIAVQVQAGGEIERLVRMIDHAPTRRTVSAERAFLTAIAAGCQTPLAASASLTADGRVTLHVQLFGRDGQCFESRDEDADAEELGRRLGLAALAEVELE
jgi:hydroxymethylbilane synthase